jgi:hypothetical protein
MSAFIRRFTLLIAVIVVGALLIARWPRSGWGPARVAPTPDEPAAALSTWPHLRGPNYDAHAADEQLAASWPAEGPPILWSRELGQGYSGFVVAEGKAFTQVQQLSGQYLLCLDLATGAELWRLRYDWAWQHAGAYPGPYASPTLSDDRVLFAAPSGLVGCADAASGELLWSRNLMREFQGKGAGFGFACTPLVEEGLVILPVGGKGASMVALGLQDGAVVWQAGDDQASYCPALPITWRGRRLVVGYLRNAVVLHDLKTGEVLARSVLSTDYDEHSAWPIYREPHLFLAAPFRVGAQLLRLDADGESPLAPLERRFGGEGLPAAQGIALKTVWSNRNFSNDVLSGVLHDDHIYGFDLRELQARVHRTSRGVFRCIDFQTGKERWATDKVGHASVLVADGKLVLLEDTGTLILARASAEGYDELARHALLPDQGVCWTPPTLWRGRLLVRNHQRALCVYVGDPARLTPQERAQAVAAADLPPVRTFAWTNLIGREPEFPNDAPSWSELAVWYAASLALFAAASMLGALVWLTGLVVRRAARRKPAEGQPASLDLTPLRSAAAVMFWLAAFVLGLIATPVAGHALDLFVWTWPLPLYVGYQLLIDVIVWSQPPNSSGEGAAVRGRQRWLPRVALVSFLALAYGYFLACQQLGLSILWSFLIGALPAWPFAVLAAKARPPARSWSRPLWVTLAYSAFFWTAAAFIAWKTMIAEEWAA